jgi:hypothetical protein
MPRLSWLASSLAAAVALLALPSGAGAQAAPSAPPPRTWSIGPYVGVSRHSPVGSYWGVTADRHHLLLGIHAAVPLRRGVRWAFCYAPEVVPLLVVTNNPDYRTVPGEDGEGPTTVEDGRSAAPGIALAPIGLEFQWTARPRLGLYAAGALGGVWFGRQVPVVDSRAFNFTFEFGAGIRWRLGERTWLRTGYKFHHLSNAKTAPENPGLDAMVFLIGFERVFPLARGRSGSGP